MKKKCTDCHKEKTLDYFYKNSRGKYGVGSICRSCNSLRTKNWRKNNPTRHKEISRINKKSYSRKIRQEMIDAYGGKCSCCGENNPKFLTLEHKFGLPESHKRVNGRRLPTTHIISLLRRDGWPDFCTILCYNCNCAQKDSGICPHKE